MIAKKHCFMDERRLEEYSQFYDFKIELRNKAQIQKQKYEGVQQNAGTVQKVKIEGESGESEVIELRKAKVLPSGELLLPNGKIAGHKEYQKYYNQNLTGIARREEIQIKAIESRNAGNLAGDGTSLSTHDNEHRQPVLTKMQKIGDHVKKQEQLQYRKKMIKNEVKYSDNIGNWRGDF